MSEPTFKKPERGAKLLQFVEDDGAWYTVTIKTVMVANKQGQERYEVTYDDYPEERPVVVLKTDLHAFPTKL